MARVGAPPPGLSQTGLHFTKDPFDRERYEEIRALAAEMTASRSDASEDFVRDLFEQQTSYATPKVDVRGAVFQEDKLLLVHERSDGYWTLPGGWANVNEPPSLAVEREILEESGYQECRLVHQPCQGHIARQRKPRNPGQQSTSALCRCPEARCQALCNCIRTCYNLASAGSADASSASRHFTCVLGANPRNAFVTGLPNPLEGLRAWGTRSDC